MNTLTRTVKATIAALLLLSQAACTNVQSTPSMVDYSYVPPNRGISVQTAPGINDY